MMSNPLRVALAATAVILAGLAVLVLLRPEPESVAEADLVYATVLPEPRPVAEFELLDQEGGRFTRSDLEGRWSLLFAGFTHCPDICPTTLSLLGDLERRLRDDGVGLEMVLLTVDPARDTPERLAEYMGHFNPRLRGATGEKAEIDRLCDSLGLGYVHVPASEGSYTVDHSSALVLVDPQARVAAYFRQPLDVDALARDLATLPRAR